ncbi:MAG: hypothetical protein U0175_38045 [Caldilineaceae bacterium]
MSITEIRQKLAGHTLWLWHYLHADWQWEQSRAWHEDRYVLAVSEALDIMRQHTEVKYYFDTASEFFEPIARKLAPRMEEIRQYVGEGRIRIVSGQVANCRPTQTADETYLRNLQIGRAYFEQTLPPTDLSLFHSVDIAIGGTQMPQILKLAGFSYYKAWRPHGPMNVLGIPHQFIWEGLDGSQIIVMRGAYGGLWQKAHVPDNYTDDWDAAVERIYKDLLHDQIIHNRSASKQLWMIQGCDDARLFRTWEGDQPMDLLGFVQMWRQRESTTIQWGTPLEYAQAVAEHRSELPVWKGVLDGCDVGYNPATNGAQGLWVWRQMNDRRLLRAEWWAAAAAPSGFAVPSETWQRLWRQHLTYQAHAQEAAFADDFYQLVDLAQEVRIQAERIERQALIALAQAAGGGDRTTQFIFNPHPWPIEANVELYHPCAAAGVESLAVVDGENQPIPHQLLHDFRHPRFAGSVNEQRLLVHLKLPAFGYRRLTIQEKAVADIPEGAKSQAVDSSPDQLETSDLKLVFRQHLLREVHDKHSGAVYFNRTGNAWPQLQFHVLDNQDWILGGAELQRISFTPENSHWLHSGPLRWQHRSVGTLGPYQAQIDTIVADQGRSLEFHVRLEGHWQKPPLTGFVTLTGDIEAGGQMTVDVPFGIEARDPDHEPYINHAPPTADLGEVQMFERLRPGFFWGRSWADWSGNGRGLTWISVDGNYYWLKEPGLFGHLLLRACARHPGTWEEFCPEVMTGSGVHSFSYVLHFHDGDWHQVDPQRRSDEARHPPVVIRPNHPTPATLPSNEHSFLTLDGPARLSAYYPQGDAAIARVVESEGTGGVLSLTFDWTPIAADAIDLTGRVLDIPLSIVGNAIQIILKPWQLVTLKIQRGTSNFKESTEQIGM